MSILLREYLRGLIQSSHTYMRPSDFQVRICMRSSKYELTLTKHQLTLTCTLFARQKVDSNDADDETKEADEEESETKEEEEEDTEMAEAKDEEEEEEEEEPKATQVGLCLV